MRKNIIILTIIFMLVISIFPSTFANNNYIDMNSDRDVFNFCYVEIDGDISNQWKIRCSFSRGSSKLNTNIVLSSTTLRVTNPYE